MKQFGEVRDGVAADAIDGVQPRYVIEPDSAEAFAGLLAWASQEHVSIVIRGRGTKLGWGRRGGRIDLVASTARLHRLLAHAHGDLTATVEAGATVLDVNRELAKHGQWLPLETSSDEATVGGTIATNESGPLRHRHGTPRDLLIGVQLATTDGRLVKAGGNVVKNVAGYDLGKLVCGSFGSLAAITTATFKLAPLPAASTTLVASFGDRRELAQAVKTVGGSQLEPSAFDLSVIPKTASTRLLLQFASTPAAVQAQIDEARRLCAAAAAVEIVTGADEADRWREQARRVWDAPGMIVRVSWLPAAIEQVVALVERLGANGSIELAGRAGVGAGLIRVEGDAAGQRHAVAELRGQRDLVGHVVVLRADQAVKEQADVWGPPGDTAGLMRAIKQALDPAAILNANRGPL